MKCLIIIFPCIFFFSCNTNNPGKGKTNAKTIADSLQHTDSLSTRQVYSSPQDSGDITVNLYASQLPVTIHRNATSNGQHLIINIRDVEAHKITAAIHTPDRERNVRFNQIIMPDSTADGPFTDSLEYKLSQKGNYSLIIGKDNMAEGKFAGNISVSLYIH